MNTDFSMKLHITVDVPPGSYVQQNLNVFLLLQTWHPLVKFLQPTLMKYSVVKTI